LAELLERLRALLLEALVDDVPAKGSEPLAQPAEGLVDVLVALAGEGEGLRTGQIGLEQVEVADVALLVERGVERQVALVDAPFGIAAADRAARVLEVLLDVGADP